MQNAIVAILLCAMPVAAQESFPEPYNSEQELGDPIPPSDALKGLRLPNGFSATLFAAEPDVMNPIAACTDAQGRVWVAENFTYAERAVRYELKLNDRVTVLEDPDGDGVHDKRTVFASNLKVLTGITVGRGGVWLMAPPQLLFIPDADEDLIPDGPAQVKLDGFHLARDNYHNFANGLSWGPDGWLYGRSGASCPGDMGLPGSTDEERVPIRGGMWRYHPERKAVEALTQGTTNPWGHDWNEVGDLFFINTVNGHFWHAIPGAHFVRPHTLDVNPHAYELIDMHADHWHFDTGKSWTASRDGAANDYGGGHAHVGMMIYQENKWPEQYQGKVMTVNMHGRRVNQESLSREGSGYVASHDPDFLVSDDTWFRGMELLPLPDGDALLIDWSDTGECHEQTGVHRTSGRIFKLQYDGARSDSPNPLLDVAVRRDPLRLARLQTEASTWVSRRARELLAVHANFGTDTKAAQRVLRELLGKQNASPQLRLRALWSLVALNAVDADVVETLLADESADLRVWGVRLVVDDWRLDTAYGPRPMDAGADVSARAVDRLVELSRRENSARVRLELASALQRLPYAHRARLATELVQYEEDTHDHNLPLMVWYGLIPLGNALPDQLLHVQAACTWSTTRQLIARRIADRSKELPHIFDRMFEIATSRDAAYQTDIVLGTSAALAGWTKARAPSSWESVIESSKLTSNKQARSAMQNLSILFGDGRTIEHLASVVRSQDLSLELRKAALQTLVDSRAAGTKELCLGLLRERFLNAVAAAGLARESDPKIGEAIIENYRRFHPSERPSAVSILASRVPWALSLLSAVEDGTLDRTEITAFQARQMASLGNARVDKQLAANWGQVRETSDMRKARIARLRAQLSAKHLVPADLSAGRKLFGESCGKCHRLYGVGGNLGPDLTGAQRSNLDYLLENIVDPSAVVTKEFRSTVILLHDGRVLNGLVIEKSDNVVTLATQDEVFKVATDEIQEIRQSTQSTMPEGLLDQLSENQTRDLFGYLQSKQQVD